MGTIWKVLTRKKRIDPVRSEETSLSRVLNTFDLTALGVGSTLGVGVYVLAGHVAKDTAGPSVILSFLIAAIASVFAGLCYAEFGARVPRAGSAYIYSYVCVGEFVAFIIGWNLILEYVIGSASVARGLSLYLDTLINNTMQDTFSELFPINIPYLSTYFDFFAFGISVILAVALAFGMKESSMANNIFTILNVAVVLFVIIAGSLKADPENWKISPNSTNSTEYNIGKGGFFPFGIEGMIKGAATCFYGFVGFDCIATTGEEVKNPKKAIPISIILSLFIIFLAYFGTSTVVTLMVPYYLQDPNAPIPHAFEVIGWIEAKWIVAIGGIFGLCASLFGAMFPLPRIIYAMGSDGLVFKFLAKVHPRFQTPVIGTLLAGVLTGLMAALFDLKQLVNMMSIGTLLAYTMVAASVLLLSYADDETDQYLPVRTNSESDGSENGEGNMHTDNKITLGNDDEPIMSASDSQDLIRNENITCGTVFKQIFNCSRQPNPTGVSKKIVTVTVFMYCIVCVLVGLSAMYLQKPIMDGEIWAITLASLAVGVAVILVLSIATQPASKKELSFKVPLMPLIPALSILVNIYLMLMLDSHTWIRFGVWMAVGLPMYIYCVRLSCSTKHSEDNKKTHKNGGVSNGNLNGHTNHSFVPDYDSISSKETVEVGKKRPAPLPPVKQFEDGKENFAIQSEAVIAQLDEILEKETCNITQRKLSDGTLSNVSNVVSSVVADVHHDNVITPTLEPTIDPFILKPSLESNNSVKGNGVIAINDNNLVVTEETVIETPLEKPDIHAHDHDYDAIEKISLNKEDVGEKLNIAELPPPPLPPALTENNILPPPVLFSTMSEYPEHEYEYIDYNQSKNLPIIDQKELENISNVPSPPTPPPSPPTPPTPDYYETVFDEPFIIPRPSTANIQSVTLRKVMKKPEEPEKNDEELPVDNLKVGSPEYKTFLNKLNSKLKLQRNTVIPQYAPQVKNDLNSNERENNTPRNENVIEDSINKNEALQKIRHIFQKKLPNEKEKLEDKSETVLEEHSENNGVTFDHTKEENQKVIQNNQNNEFNDHKNKMQNVFSSMNLKKLEKLNNDPDKDQRFSKSLGARFNKDDQVVHRQKMGEIFKSIKLRRKDSAAKSDDGVEKANT